jgi:hypothetical protein
MSVLCIDGYPLERVRSQEGAVLIGIFDDAAVMFYKTIFGQVGPHVDRSVDKRFVWFFFAFAVEKLEVVV